MNAKKIVKEVQDILRVHFIWQVNNLTDQSQLPHISSACVFEGLFVATIYANLW